MNLLGLRRYASVNMSGVQLLRNIANWQLKTPYVLEWYSDIALAKSD
jgi:hypothetical protein